MFGASLSALECTRVLGANDRIGVAVVGCGMRGLLGEVLQFSKESNISVAGVCDLWKQQRETAAEKVKQTGAESPKLFEHFDEALADKTVDAVLISTPDHQHCTQLSQAIHAKKDVYVEKPLAMNMKELLSAVDTVKKSDRIVQCGTQVRSWAPTVAARAFVSSGGLGNIFKIEQSRNSLHPYWDGGAARKVAEADTDWKAFLMGRKYRAWDADQYAGWMAYREFSRGPHTQFMAHFIDTVHFVTGAKYPDRVMAMGGTFRWKDARRTAPDSIEVVLEYKEGFLVRYNSSFGTNGNSFLKFLGTRGTIDATKWNNPWLVSAEGAENTKIPDAPATHHMKNWFDCLRSRQQPAAPIKTGYGHSVACIMADESFQRGRRMVHDPAKRSIHEG